MTHFKPTQTTRLALPKSPTGIKGLDEITGGGLPKGRPTLICGGTGCGKTLLAMEFLVRGALEYNEPGVFMAFEEAAKDLAQNVASLGFDLEALIDSKMMVLDYVHVERSEIEVSGQYDLEGLFIRLDYAIKSIGAKRVVLDTIESLFGGIPNELILRSEFLRLFTWLKEKGVTAVITGESGENTLTRNGLEEYVSDCVIKLDNRVKDQTSSRRLRVVKYRGSTHGTNEYPFLIDEDGFSVVPITSLALQHIASSVRVPTGIARLDTMLTGEGFYKGSSILVSGTAGTGKSSIAAHFVDAACRRGERAIYFAFEESPEQIMRNMHSIGINLGQWVDKGLLRFQASRPTLSGLEMHLAQMHKAIDDFHPHIVIADPINSFLKGNNLPEVKIMLMLLVDLLKTAQITALFTSLTSSGSALEQSEVGISSIIDTWILVQDIESNGERNRGLYILKSRGMAHSNQIREFLLTNNGIELRDVYIGEKGILTGSARLVQESQEKAALLLQKQEVDLRKVELERKRTVLEAHIAVLRAEFEVEELAAMKILKQEKAVTIQIAEEEDAMRESRTADAKQNKPKGVE